MKLKKYIAFCILATIFSPSLTLATITSETFSVDNEVITADVITNDATSANFGTENKSGFVYVYDEPVALSGAGGSSESTKTNRYSTISNSTLTEVDSILVCHDKDGQRFASYVNINVFITLLEYGKSSGNGGHETHELDIVPPFKYQLNGLEKEFSGKNWTAPNQLLHENSCEKYLQFSSQTVKPDIKPEEIPTTPVNQITTQVQPDVLITPVSECEDKNTAKKIVTDINDQTLLTILIPTNALRTISNNSSSTVYFQIAPVPEFEYQSRAEQFLLETRSETVELEIPRYVPPSIEFQNQQLDKISYEPLCVPLENGTFPAVTDQLQVAAASKKWKTSSSSSISLSDIGLLTTPFSISAKSEQSGPITTFTKPVQVRVFSAQVSAVASTIYVTKPSADNLTWFEVPFSITGNNIVFEADTTDTFYIWYLLPKESPILEDIQKPNTEVLGFLDEVFIPAVLFFIVVLILILFLIYEKRKHSKK